MGKKKRRLLSAKFANWRKARGLEKAEEVEAPVVEEKVAPVEPVLDIEVVTTKDLMEESEADVVVIKNKAPSTPRAKKTAVPTPEPQLQQVEIEKPKRKPSGLKQTRTRRKTTKTKKD